MPEAVENMVVLAVLAFSHVRALLLAEVSLEAVVLVAAYWAVVVLVLAGARQRSLDVGPMRDRLAFLLGYPILVYDSLVVADPFVSATPLPTGHQHLECPVVQQAGQHNSLVVADPFASAHSLLAGQHLNFPVDQQAGQRYPLQEL